VSSQTGTADGVAALARGDYQRAAEILKPIAEDWRSDDTAAQFFMAGLYDTGRGVPADPLRACALYMRAMSNHDSLFGREASLLAGKAIGRGPEFMRRATVTLSDVTLRNAAGQR
jgi:TPR repeat protein